MPVSDAHRAIHAVYRLESVKLVAVLTRFVRDVGLAEELAQDALLAALEQWPESGVPDNPGAWLMAAAKHRAINVLRRGQLIERKHAEIGRTVEPLSPEIEAMLDDEIGDEVLSLVFTACHPLLSREARVALTLRLIGGLTTEEIARAFLVPEPTMAQRIVRAKRVLAQARVPFEVPRGADLGARLSSVLEVVYLVFNEGYAATTGDDWMRPRLCEEAMRLGRILTELLPQESEVHGLVALMELNASRSAARTTADGDPILLLDQDRSRWDPLLIQRGLRALERALALDGHGPYAIQGAIAACHARARVAGETDWRRIADLYTDLAAQAPSPVVELNRAMAVAMVDGPASGLALVDALAGESMLADYAPLPSARADLLFRLGRLDEARVEFERAATLTTNTRQRARLLERAAACARSQR